MRDGLVRSEARDVCNIVPEEVWCEAVSMPVSLYVGACRKADVAAPLIDEKHPENWAAYRCMVNGPPRSCYYISRNELAGPQSIVLKNIAAKCFHVNLESLFSGKTRHIPVLGGLKGQVMLHRGGETSGGGYAQECPISAESNGYCVKFSKPSSVMRT